MCFTCDIVYFPLEDDLDQLGGARGRRGELPPARDVRPTEPPRRVPDGGATGGAPRGHQGPAAAAVAQSVSRELPKRLAAGEEQVRLALRLGFPLLPRLGERKCCSFRAFWQPKGPEMDEKHAKMGLSEGDTARFLAIFSASQGKMGRSQPGSLYWDRDGFCGHEARKAPLMSPCVLLLSFTYYQLYHIDLV